MISRREFAMGSAVVTTALMSGALDAPAFAKGVGSARVEGPVTGGKRGQIHGGFFGDDLAAHGYVEEEYFVSGTATSYKPVGDLTPDGLWTVTPEKTAPYKTRVIVHRPKDPAQFNGVMMCEWTNVSTFHDVSNAVNECFYKSGYVYIAVSAQKVGVEGLESAPEGSLHDWDPDRYGSLHIPGDGFSYDIFTQVCRALADPRARTGVDPLPGLKVKGSIATGESQSAARLCSYINAIHPVAKFFSAFIPCVMVGGGSELYTADVIPGESKEAYNKRFFARIVPTTVRNDLDVPILIMESETEAQVYRVPIQPDAKWLRVWEIAGAVHGSSADMGYRADISQREGFSDPMGKYKDRFVRFMPTMASAGLALLRWKAGGDPLRKMPRLLVGDKPRTIATDANGNGLGGVRLPEVEVPTSVYMTKIGPAGMGSVSRIPDDRLRVLYPTDKIYLDEMRAAVDWCLVEDVIPDWRAQEYLEMAKRGPLAQA